MERGSGRARAWRFARQTFRYPRVEVQGRISESSSLIGLRAGIAIPTAASPEGIGTPKANSNRHRQYPCRGRITDPRRPRDARLRCSSTHFVIVPFF